MIDTIAHPQSITAQRTLDGFLARYRGQTRTLYEIDMRIYLDWCDREQIESLAAVRSDIERFARHLEDERGNKASTVAHRLGVLRMFYKITYSDGMIDRDPSAFIRRPNVYRDPHSIVWTDRFEIGRLKRAAATTSAAHETLVVLMGYLGLRVSEACSINIENITESDEGYRVMRFIRKGNKPATMPLPPIVMRVFDRAIDGRTSGPLIVTKRGNRQNRNGAYDWIKRLAVKAGLDPAIHPHSLRHGMATEALDDGVSIREVARMMGHEDPRTTTRYDRGNFDLDSHPAHAVARRMHMAA